jgi:hypothetical protein
VGSNVVNLKRAAKRATDDPAVDGILLGDIRKVELMWEEGTPTSYLIHKDEVETFIDANLKLHYDPGINPATKEKTARVWQIRVGKLKRKGPYWWTSPALDGAKPGAHIFDCYGTTCVWMSDEAERRFAEMDD